MAKVTLDFTNVKDQGGISKKRMPSGDYAAKITAVNDSPSKKDDVAMLMFTVQLDATASATYPYYCKIQENQLWKLRNLLVAAGFNVPKKRISIDPEKLIGKRIAVTLDDAEYEGREQSEISAVIPLSELDGQEVDEPDTDDDEEEEAPTPPPARKKRAAPAPEPEEEEEEEEEETPPPAPKKKRAAAPTPPPADDEDEDEIDIEDLD